MPTQRNLAIDLFALGLLAVVVFATLSLLTYDAADPPSTLVFPARAATLNACGHSGALASHSLLSAFGLGAYYLVLSLGVLDGWLLTRRRITAPALRPLGWLLSLLGLSTLSALALAQFAPGPAIGAGGYLGAAGRGWLETHFASTGAFILVLSAIVGGLLLSTDYVLL
ncbi:MAG: DNA translocase FtsK 4TM domain-containing protein, partial [Pirellulales bacterium]